jgi:hypothetical protein
LSDSFLSISLVRLAALNEIASSRRKNCKPLHTSLPLEYRDALKTNHKTILQTDGGRRKIMFSDPGARDRKIDGANEDAKPLQGYFAAKNRTQQAHEASRPSRFYIWQSIFWRFNK